jgi:hypothetical protein
MGETPLNYGDQLFTPLKAAGYAQRRLSGTDANPWLPATLSRTLYVTGEGLRCQDQPVCVFDHFGQYRIDQFTNPKTNDVLIIYTYYWDADLWTIEGNYLHSDLARQRSPINMALKDGVVDYGLSDAAGYLGPMGQLVREGVETTLCQMVASAIGAADASAISPGHGCLARLSAIRSAYPDDVEFDFLSHSLGSRMLYDVLNPQPPGSTETLSADQLRSRRFIALHSRSFLMAANQLSLLAIGRVQVTDDRPLADQAASTPAAISRAERLPAGEATCPTPQTFFDLRCMSAADQGREAQPPRLDVVGFLDPDDLLGFKASDTLNGAPTPQSLNFVNVIHRNTPQWAWLFAWPPSAHDHELEEETSTRLILCGGSVNAAGALIPNNCTLRR